MKQPPRILFLYAHVQPFLLAGIQALIKNYNAEVFVVCWQLSEVSPTHFQDGKHLSFLIKTGNNRTEVKKRIADFNAGIVYTVGWMDKDYLKWTKEQKRAGKTTVMSMDAQWTGSLRQYINCMIAPLFLHRIYTHAWIPGYFQYEYARKLGFKRENILTRLLSPDITALDSLYKNDIEKNGRSSKTLLYMGRLVAHKFEGILSAFAGLSEGERNGWKLAVAGKGPMENDPRLADADIAYHGFLQQRDLFPLMKSASVFCLTASDEPWGTVVQEAAAAGLPLLLSRQCGAHYSFLIPGYNGYLCDGDNVEDIRDKLRAVTSLTPPELLLMGKRSNEMAVCDNSDTWAATLMSIYQ